MKNNIFYDSVNEATQILMENFGIKFSYTAKEHGIDTAAYDFDNDTIYLPSINPFMLTSQQREEYRALVYHETRHCLFTDKEMVKKSFEESEFIKQLCNVIEDTRIESIKAKVWYGGKHSLTDLRLRWAAKYEQEMKEKKTAEKNPIGFLITAMVYRNYQPFDIPDHLLPYWKASEDILNDGRLDRSLNTNKKSSLVVYDIAKDIEKAWNELIENDPKMQQKATKDSEGEGKGEGKGEGEQKPVKVKVKDVKYDNGKNQGGQGGGKPLEDGDEVTLVVSDKYDEDNQGDNKIEIDNMKEAMEKLAQAASEKFQKEILQNQTIDPNWRPPEGDPTLPLNVSSQEVIPKKDPDAFKAVRDGVSMQIQGLKNQILRMMFAQKQTKTTRNHKRGKLDSKQFYKVIDNNYKVKKRTSQKKEIKSAVTLVLDLSGSMAGQKAVITNEIAVIFGESMKAIGDIKLEIIGYRTGGSWHSDNTEDVEHYMFKKFDESWEQAKDRLGDYRNCVGGANVDHYSVEYAAHRLMQRPEKNRMMFVICDGLPNGNNGTYGNLLPKCLKHTVKKIKKAKIKLFCWGIVSEAIKEYYAPDCVILESITNLNQITLKKAAQYILE